MALKRRACSASDLKPELIASVTPAAEAAAAIRSKAAATSGRIPCPCLMTRGPEYPPPVAIAMPVRPPPERESPILASALTRLDAGWISPLSRTGKVTRARSGANEAASGKPIEIEIGEAPLARAIRRATATARAR